ncbi:MAG: transketolase C-terminal domain-containing protein [Thermodesulfobacteriota bacterium]|nr:transketolase C-terminal domain-containing protein [Thermodesulfobacteriota bacterium]
MVIKPASTKMWSRIGSRAAFGLAAVELGATIDDLMVLTADVATSAGLQRFRSQYPEKFADVGIAEQNMMGIAAGLASEGLKVVTATFAPFQTMRCCEQIRVNLGYMQQNVCMVGLASGITLGTLGYTHCCFEDVAIMRAIPGITVLSPADCTETVKATLAAPNHTETVYIRLTGGANNPIVYESDYPFEIGKANILSEGDDVTIIAAGTMVYESIKAAESLSEQGVSTGVVDMHTIKPLDTLALDRVLETSKLIVTVEEHSVIGGLGSAVAEYKAGLANSPPQLILGLPDAFGKPGEYRHLLERNGLTAEQIAKRVLNHYGTLYQLHQLQRCYFQSSY